MRGDRRITGLMTSDGFWDGFAGEYEYFGPGDLTIAKLDTGLELNVDWLYKTFK